MLHSRFASWDLRPLSEYFYEQAEGRNDFHFLFYCRECIKNFDAPIRVKSCKFCGKESIVELPKQAWMRRQPFRGTFGYGLLRAVFSRLAGAARGAVKAGRKAVREKKEPGFGALTKLRLARAYYFDGGAPDSGGDEQPSQGSTSRSFELV